MGCDGPPALAQPLPTNQPSDFDERAHRSRATLIDQPLAAIGTLVARKPSESYRLLVFVSFYCGFLLRQQCSQNLVGVQALDSRVDGDLAAVLGVLIEGPLERAGCDLDGLLWGGRGRAGEGITSQGSAGELGWLDKRLQSCQPRGLHPL